MSTLATMTPIPWAAAVASEPSGARVPALTVLWAPFEPERVGEIALLTDAQGWILGRGAGPEEPGTPRLRFLRARGAEAVHRGPLATPTLSRVQLRLEPAGGDALRVERLGRCGLRLGGRPMDGGLLRPGDLLELTDQLLLLYHLRPPAAALTAEMRPLFPFGGADPDGLVGESAALWAIRHRIQAYARQDVHVLVMGESGTGKELAVRAIHRRSRRGARALVARNATTLPETLIDAELFGNAPGFPNPEMPERPGLIGQADGSSLFLDEIGDLPAALQVHLLRVLDEGEHQRLGEPLPRRASVRLLAATNRALGDLRPDLAARFPLLLIMPSLNDRREDIPLLIRAIVLGLAEDDPALVGAMLQPRGGRQEPRLSPALMSALVTRRYTTHLRELRALLYHAALYSGGLSYLDLPPELPPEGPLADPEPPPPAPAREGGPFNAEERRRLELLRTCGFNPQEYALRAEPPLHRSTAHTHLTVLLLKALCEEDFDVHAAAEQVAGPTGRAQALILADRLRGWLEGVRGRIQDDGEPAVRASLRRRFRSDWPAVEAALDRLTTAPPSQAPNEDAP